MFRRLISKRIIKKCLAVLTLIVVFSILITYNNQKEATETYLFLKRSNLTKEYLKPATVTNDGKVKLLLFVGIHSAPTRLDRRKAIRETWMKECRGNPDAVCRFFTDGQDVKGHRLEAKKGRQLENESRVYEDMLLADVPGGVNFALKFLWMIQWAKERYDFHFFLRLDDDYFICFEKLMLELEVVRPREKFQWGWLHCDLKGMIFLISN